MSQQPFVLVVEDDAKLRNIIARILEEFGYMVFQAASFLEALDRIAIKPNLMILDINLPDATGWDVAQWLEAIAGPVPIIVISGLTPDEKRLRQIKPKAFLPKPFTVRELVGLVEQYAPVHAS